jgi:hypothetical protein
MPWNWQSRPRCDRESLKGRIASQRCERDPAKTRHAFEPVGPRAPTSCSPTGFAKSLHRKERRRAGIGTGAFLRTKSLQHSARGGFRGSTSLH